MRRHAPSVETAGSARATHSVAVLLCASTSHYCAGRSYTSDLTLSRYNAQLRRARRPKQARSARCCLCTKPCPTLRPRRTRNQQRLKGIYTSPTAAGFQARRQRARQRTCSQAWMRRRTESRETGAGGLAVKSGVLGGDGGARGGGMGDVGWKGDTVARSIRSDDRGPIHAGVGQRVHRRVLGHRRRVLPVMPLHGTAFVMNP